MKSNELIKQTHPLITPDHLRRLAIVYVRQSTEEQVRDNTGSTEYQRGLTEVGRSLGWHDSQIQIIDEDLGRSGSSAERRTGLQRLQMMIAAKQVGVVIVVTVSRLSRNVLDFELFRILAAAHKHVAVYRWALSGSRGLERYHCLTNFSYGCSLRKQKTNGDHEPST